MIRRYRTHKRPRLIPGLAVMAGILMPLVMTLASACPMKLPELELEVKGAKLKLEIAATPGARNCGLSRRTSLSANNGMLFVFPEPIILDFWMRDTQLPLSIAFIGDNGHILSIQHMQPMQTREHYRSPKPVRYALEVNRGWFSDHQLEVGDVIPMQFPNVMPAQ